MGNVSLSVKLRVWNEKNPVEKTTSDFFENFRKYNPKMKLEGSIEKGTITIDTVTSPISGTYTIKGLILSIDLNVPFTVPISTKKAKELLEQKFKDFNCTIL